MKTAVSIETDDRVRYLIGIQITGEPTLATREQVRAYFSVVFDTEVGVLEARADALIKETIERLETPHVTNVTVKRGGEGG